MICGPYDGFPKNQSWVNTSTDRTFSFCLESLAVDLITPVTRPYQARGNNINSGQSDLNLLIVQSFFGFFLFKGSRRKKGEGGEEERRNEERKIKERETEEKRKGWEGKRKKSDRELTNL